MLRGGNASMKWVSRPVGSTILVGAGVLVALLGPSVLWSTHQDLLRLQAGRTLSATLMSSLAFGGVALFALGWLLVGVGLWGRRGLLAAAVAYWLVGLVWVVAFNLSVGSAPTSLLHPVILLAALMWPLLVAQVLGLFGLSIG